MTEHRDTIAKIPIDLQNLVCTDMRLSQLTTFRIGGPAALVCQIPNPDAAQRFQAFARNHALPTYVLGGGSNILAADDGFPGLLLHVTSDTLHQTGRRITVGAGRTLDDVVVQTLDMGLAGLEFASGVPGTIGGALVGNAGCYGREICEFLREALILRRDGRLEKVDAQAFGFSYRHTQLRETGDIILEATLELTPGDCGAEKARRLELLADRRAKHPVNLPCAGSYFRNLPPDQAGGRRQAAGALLEQVGAKSMHEGDAQVFSGHANMIVNRGQAGSQDVLRLADRMKAAVRETFAVDLVEEVRYLGPDLGL